jgi:general secretion pathway protein K
MATLWLMVAISTVTLAIGVQGRELRAAAANRAEAVRAKEITNAGLEHARAELERRARGSAAVSAIGLLDPWATPERLLPAGGRLSDGARYTLAARDLGALLNVNRASELELRRFLTALAIDDGRSDRIAQAIADWRDPDDARRARGAEADAYLEAGSPVLPENGAFRRVEDLRHVLGMTEAVYERIAPLVSVAGTGRVNLASAPVPVLAALPGMEPALIRTVLERRRAGPLGSIVELADDLPPDARAAFEAHLPDLVSRTTVRTQELEIVSEGWYEGAPTRARTMAVAVRSGEAVFLFRRDDP